MVLVHFSLVMSADHLEEGVLSRVIEFMDGRAAATFVALAGVGLTLRTRGVTEGGDEALTAARAVLICRGLFLPVVGYLNLLIWPGDILRVYGISLLVAAWFLRSSGRTLWLLALAFVAGFIVLLALIDYSKNWDWETMDYRNLWTPSGVFRNLFYDGFRSVFPWTGLIFFGMWLGRQDFRRRSVCSRFLLIAIGILVAAELSSRLLVLLLDREEAVFLFGTVSMPPLPLFLLSAGGTAVAVIAASVLIAERFPMASPVRALVATGQLAFTWYALHIVLGLGAVDSLGWTEDRPLAVGFATGAAFFLLAALLSLLWRSRFRYAHPADGRLKTAARG